MILYSTWLKTKLDVRHKIAAAFGIPKSNPTHVADNQVVQDGFQVEEIEGKLTVPAMQEYLSSKETDPNLLFDQLVLSVTTPEFKANIPPEPIVPGTVEDSMSKPEKIKQQKPVVKEKTKKAAKKTTKPKK